jgi:hypothetical protein
MMTQNIHCRFVDGVFTPQEVEAMTGIVPVLQRTWKQRGYIRHHTHVHARLTVHELAQIMALQFASQSIPVEMKFVHEAVAEAAPSILWFALFDVRAWDIDGTAEQKAIFKRALDSDNAEPLRLESAVGLNREKFGRYIVLRPEEWEFVNDLNDTFADERTPAAVVIDLVAIAKRLVESRKRPRGLIRVTDIRVGKIAPLRRRPDQDD